MGNSVLNNQVAAFTGDANNLATTGLYKTDSGATNCPSTNGFLLVIAGAGVLIQFVCAYDGTNIQYRTHWYGTWYAWKKLL